MDITYRCGLKCYNCNRYTHLDSRGETDFTISQLTFLIAESKKLKWNWERIRLVGGEPTLHPDFRSFVSMLDDYVKKENLNTTLVIFTRGVDPKIVKELVWVEENFPNWQIGNTKKRDRYHSKFARTDWAPRDFPEYQNEEYSGCDVPNMCGVGLTYSGFYPAGTCGGLARFFNVEGIKTLKEVTVENLISLYSMLCSNCGLYKRLKNKERQQDFSLSWKNAIEHGPYPLTLYGINK